MTSAKPITHRDAWDQIPWLINGTLDEAEATALRAYIDTDPDCKAELLRQQGVSDAIQAFDASAPDPAAALDRIAHRLTPQKADPGVFDWLRGVVSRLASPTTAVMGGAAALATVVVVFGLSLTQPRFETLTSPDFGADGIELRLRFQPDANADAIRALMVEAGAMNVIGPSETGLMRGTVDQAIAGDVIERLKSDPRIVFVTRDD